MAGFVAQDCILVLLLEFLVFFSVRLNWNINFSVSLLIMTTLRFLNTECQNTIRIF